MPIKVTVLEAKKKASRKDVRKVVEKYVRKGRKELEILVGDWFTPVGFDEVYEENESEIRGILKSESDIFRYVDKGTNVRYATMTQGFKPKTIRGSLRSANNIPSSVAYISRKQPRSGIQARNFGQAVLDLHGKQFDEELSNL